MKEKIKIIQLSELEDYFTLNSLELELRMNLTRMKAMAERKLILAQRTKIIAESIHRLRQQGIKLTDKDFYKEVDRILRSKWGYGKNEVKKASL